MISLHNLTPLYDLLSDQPELIQQLQQRFSLPPHIGDSDLFDEAMLDQILLFLEAQPGVDNIAYKLGFTQSMFALGDLASLMLYSATLADALLLFQQHYLQQPTTHSKLSVSLDDAYLHFHVDTEDCGPEIGRLRCQLKFATVMQTLKTLCGPLCCPKTVTLRYYQPIDFAAFNTNTLMGNQTLCDIGAGDTNTMSYPKTWLNSPLCAANPRMLTLLQQHLQPQQELAEPVAITLSERLISWLQGLPNLSCANATAAAEQLQLSERSLARKLAIEGSSFRDILASARHMLAIEALVDDRPIAEIAKRLGFNDRKAFERAFVRWSGVRPVLFKKQYRQYDIEQDEGSAYSPSKLAPMSLIAETLLKRIQEQSIGIDELLSLMAMDPVLMARVLGLLNTRFFGSITLTVMQQHLLKHLGIDWLNQVIERTLQGKTEPLTVTDLQGRKLYWLAMMSAARLSRYIGSIKKLGPLTNDQLYICSLIQCTGFLYLQQHHHDAFFSAFAEDASDLPHWKLQNSLALQRKHIGHDGFEISIQLLQAWGVPSIYIQTIEQISRKDDENMPPQARLMCGCNEIAVRFVMGDHEDTPALSQLAQQLGLDEDKVMQGFQQFLIKYPEYQKKSDSLFPQPS